MVSNIIGWGEGVLNLISWGSDGMIEGVEVTNLITEQGVGFLCTEEENLLVLETNEISIGFGSAYDHSWSGETLLER